MGGDHCRSRSSRFRSFKFSEAPNLFAVLVDDGMQCIEVVNDRGLGGIAADRRTVRLARSVGLHPTLCAISRPTRAGFRMRCLGPEPFQM